MERDFRMSSGHEGTKNTKGETNSVIPPSAGRPACFGQARLLRAYPPNHRSSKARDWPHAVRRRRGFEVPKAKTRGKGAARGARFARFLCAGAEAPSRRAGLSADRRIPASELVAGDAVS